VDPTGGDEAGYAPVGARIGAACVLAIAAWWAVDLALAGRVAELVRALPWLLLVGVVDYAVFWRPAVLVDDEGVGLRNIVRDVRVPWGALTALDTRYALTLVTDGGRYQSWAAAAPGKPSLLKRGFFDRRLASGQEVPEAGRRDAADPRWLAEGARGERSSAALTSDSGAAAFLVDQRWRRWQATTATAARPDPTHEAPGSSGRPSVTWNVPLATTAVVLLLACLLTRWVG